MFARRGCSLFLFLAGTSSSPSDSCGEFDPEFFQQAERDFAGVSDDAEIAAAQFQRARGACAHALKRGVFRRADRQQHVVCRAAGVFRGFRAGFA